MLIENLAVATPATEVVRRTNRLLAALPAADFSVLAPSINEVVLERGMLLQELGDLVENVYFPHSGIVSLVAVMRTGVTVETATIGREGVIGATVDPGSRRAFGRAIVQLPGTAACIPFSQFHAAASRSRAIRDLIVRYNELLIAQIHQSVACNALHDVEARLCRWLLQTCDRLGNDTVPLTQDFLAQMLGVRRTTVTIVARDLQAAGLIRYRRGLIHIVNRTALEESACECYDTIRHQMDGLVPGKESQPSIRPTLVEPYAIAPPA
jgi:CRP-like cAMP-binding protein